MSIKVVLLDLFGVLFKDRWKEWLKKNEKSLRQFAESSPPLIELGCTASYPEYYYDLIRINTDEKSVAGKPLIDDETFYHILAKASNKPAKSIKEVLHDTSVLNKDLLPLIDILRRKSYKIGVVTNGDQGITQEFIGAHNLSSLFDIIVTSADVGKKKPHPAIFNKVASALNVELSEMLLIDDSEKTGRSVKNLGIKAIYYHEQNIIKLQQEIEKLVGKLV